MKRLPNARFFRVDIEEKRLLLLGPITQKAESHYTFQDSIRPQRTATFPYAQGLKMTELYLTEPVLVFHEKKERVYWYQHRFILCTKPEHDEAAVKAWVEQNDDRQAKRGTK
ncbi:hypothetical protein BH09VER1_BH09VER1_31870 [soil metagenome]